MKKWRVIYWFNATLKTSWIVRAESKEEAKQKFKDEKGYDEDSIIEVYEAATWETN